VSGTAQLPTSGAMATPPLSTHVTVRVVTTPPGADVFLDDERTPRGKTPLALLMPRTNENARVTVRLRGYESQAAEVTPDSDSRLQMTLVKAGAFAAPKSRHAAHKSAPAATPKPTIPDLHRGDVVDPFAR
jgi:hypothetical protein